MSVTTVATQLPAPITMSPSPFSRIVRPALVGGIVGAAIGAGLSFTALPFIGALAAPIAAAIGGAAGLIVGGTIGLLRGRSSGSDQATVGARQMPRPAGSGTGTALPPPPPGSGSGTALPPPLPS